MDLLIVGILSFQSKIKVDEVGLNKPEFCFLNAQKDANFVKGQTKSGSFAKFLGKSDLSFSFFVTL